MEVLDDYPSTVPLLNTLIRLLYVSLRQEYNSKDIERIRSAMEQLNFTQSSQCNIIFRCCCETGRFQGAWLEMQVSIHWGYYIIAKERGIIY